MQAQNIDNRILSLHYCRIILVELKLLSHYMQLTNKPRIVLRLSSEFRFFSARSAARFSKQLQQNGLDAEALPANNQSSVDFGPLKAFPIRFPFRGRNNSTSAGDPCTCADDYNCSCCAGIQQFNFKRQRNLHANRFPHNVGHNVE